MPGKWFDEFQAGDVINHAATVRITQADNAAYCKLTHNTQPLHLDEDAAKKAGFPTFLVNGLYTFSLAVGISVPDTTQGTLIANLGYSDVQHPKPVFPGDVLSFHTKVVEARTSSKPGRGIVTLEHVAKNQDRVDVCTFRRVVLVQNRPETHS